MTQPDSSLPTDAALERLLSEIYLRVRQERFAEANERMTKAKEMAPDHPRVIELEGDIAYVQKRFVTAEKLFKKAHELDPKNAKIEEKYATALLKVHMPEYLSHNIPDDSFWSNRIPRIPAISALQSAFVSGLGQLYNGDWFKGLIIFILSLLCNLINLRHIANEIYAAKGTLASVSFSFAIKSISHGPYLLLAFIAFIIWAYAVVDAWLVAKSTT